MIKFFSEKPIGVKLGLIIWIMLFCLLNLTLWLAAKQGANLFFNRQTSEMLTHGEKLAQELSSPLSEGEIGKILGYWSSISGYSMAVTDKDGRILTSGDKSHLPVNKILVEAREVKGNKPLIRTELHPNFGQEMVSVYMPLDDGRRLILHHTVVETSQIINNMRLSLVIIGVVILILGILLSFLISFWLVKPIKKLIEATKCMGDGNFQIRAGLEQQDEIGQLARAFNQMAENLALEEERRHQFLADVSHELRTPLFIIQANAEAYMDGLIPDGEKAFNNILNEVEKLKGMVNELRGLSQIKAHNPIECNEEFDLVIILQKVIDKFKPMLMQKQVKLENRLLLKSYTLKGDSENWEKVFYNLIDNALRHTPVGGSIMIGLQSENNHVQIVVADTGQGLNQKDIPFLWERFYKCESSRTPNKSGMGLGLAIVKEVVTAYGGVVEASNNQTGGASFKINLPKKLNARTYA